MKRYRIWVSAKPNMNSHLSPLDAAMSLSAAALAGALGSHRLASATPCEDWDEGSWQVALENQLSPAQTSCPATGQPYRHAPVQLAEWRRLSRLAALGAMPRSCTEWLGGWPSALSTCWCALIGLLQLRLLSERTDRRGIALIARPCYPVPGTVACHADASHAWRNGAALLACLASQRRRPKRGYRRWSSQDLPPVACAAQSAGRAAVLAARSACLTAIIRGSDWPGLAWAWQWAGPGLPGVGICCSAVSRPW